MKTNFLKFAALLVISLSAYTKGYSQTYVKGNVALATVLVPNFAIETKLAEKWSLQLDATASFWKSINGGPQEFFIISPELRYHVKELDHGAFVGIHTGASFFKLQKYNYWNTDNYQIGLAYLAGLTFGYNFKLNDKWGLEAFIGGGFIGSYYKGYKLSTGKRYDSDQTIDREYDISGDWLPYKGGLMLVYKL